MPCFVSHRLARAGDPFRKITFLIALGMIMGAAISTSALILAEAWRRMARSRRPREPVAGEDDWKRTNTGRLLAWVAFWGAAVVVRRARCVLQPAGGLHGVAIALVFVFAMVNGISLGISDQNPISSAFVVTVLAHGRARADRTRSSA